MIRSFPARGVNTTVKWRLAVGRIANRHQSRLAVVAPVVHLDQECWTAEYLGREGEIEPAAGETGSALRIVLLELHAL